MVGTGLAIPALDALGIIQYVFTTRQNGLGARAQGIKQLDDWKPVAAGFGIGLDRLVTVNQVHGDSIAIVSNTNYQALRSTEADAIITREPSFAIGIETADCVPILIVDPVQRAVAAVHAGWRSTVKKIVEKTVQKMGSEFGSEPGRLVAAIGPAIGPECYEVDEPVIGPIRKSFPYWKEVTAPRGNDRWSLDLPRLNRQELIRTGVPQENIYSFGLCTSCNRDLFYSFRREGRTGRMLSAIMIKS